MREYAYHLCDVFTSTPLQGNQLAVFENAAGLSNAEMQSLARETNLSETAFIVRRDPAMEALRGVRVRIFTVQEELPFAGHPTLGTASCIRQFLPEYAGKENIKLELNAGAVTVDFSNASAPQAGHGPLHGEMTQPDPVFGSLHDAAAVAEAIDVPADALAPAMPLQTVSTGMPFCIVPFRSVEALAKLQIHAAKAQRYLQSTDAKFFYCIAPELRGVWRARMQFYNGEDPATGSAAGCAIAYLVRHGFAESDEEVHIRQGIEMGRASELGARAKRMGDSIREVRISGSTVFVATGRFFLA